MFCPARMTLIWKVLLVTLMTVHTAVRVFRVGLKEAVTFPSSITHTHCQVKLNARVIGVSKRLCASAEQL